MISRQLQLHLTNQPGLKSQGRFRRRSGHAHWWFERMRGIVEDAPDWSAAPSPTETTPPAAPQAPPTAPVGPPPAPPAYRWKFSRARQVRWE